MDPHEQRLQEILGGKRSWNVRDDADGDYSLFYDDFLVPLRLLKEAAYFEDLREHEGNYRDGKKIDQIAIVGNPKNR